MGMPPPPKRKSSRQSKSYRSNQGRRHYEPIIPKEYAEDVEFVEIKEFTARQEISSDSKSSKIYHESQISDVEWIEIKSSKTQQDL